MAELVCDHVAVLVEDIEQSLSELGDLANQAGPVETFEAEGTREVYVGTGRSKLLLLQAIGPGPYQRALEKRGPGLHHLAFMAPKPKELLASLPGWFLHPHTLESQAHTLWACRPGLPLLELMTGKPGGEPLLSAVEFPAPAEAGALLVPLSGAGFTVGAAPRTRLSWAGGEWEPPRGSNVE